MCSKLFGLLIPVFILTAQAAPSAAQTDHTLNNQLAAADFDKFELWTNGTQLRGANIWQRTVVPEVDGDEFLGADHVGPPFSQADFDRLAALGANYVNLSHPGLFTERPPYILDEAVQANLDRLLEMAAQAHLYAVITFRTGPGRSDFTFYRDGAGDWFDPSLLVETVWSDPEAQQAWAEMWRYTAGRYRNNPVVVGYDLLCEPNASGVVFEIYDGEEFLSQYGGTVYDWNQFYPQVVSAIREMDGETPILVGAEGWSGVRWLPYLQPVEDPHVVYLVHQYEPQDGYTHQDLPAANGYPGELDLDWDGEPDTFDRDWLDGFLEYIDEFKARTGAPVAVNEYGVERWVPGAALFLQDEIALFEARGMNHAIWAWNPAWPAYSQSVHGMDYTFGIDPDNLAVDLQNELLQVLQASWQQNILRP